MSCKFLKGPSHENEIRYKFILDRAWCYVCEKIICIGTRLRITFSQEHGLHLNEKCSNISMIRFDKRGGFIFSYITSTDLITHAKSSQYYKEIYVFDDI
jgi:hypothetical protein